MSIGTILLIILLVFLLSGNLGWYGTGFAGPGNIGAVLVAILLIWLLFGRGHGL